MSNKLIVIAQKETTRKDQLGVRITKDDLNSTQVEADTITPNLIQETNGSRYSRMDHLWKTTFQKFQVIWSAYADHITLNFLKAVFQNFTWSILEYLSPNGDETSTM